MFYTHVDGMIHTGAINTRDRFVWQHPLYLLEPIAKSPAMEFLRFVDEASVTSNYDNHAPLLSCSNSLILTWALKK